MMRIATLLLAAVLSAVLTAGIRRYAIAHSVLDIPNERSSHWEPTPRGGGLAIAAVALAGLVVGGLLGWVSRSVVAALLGGGVLVAGIGWLDDHRSVGAGTRALVHAAAAAWAVVVLGGLPELDLGAVDVRLGLIGALLAVVGIVWAINFYNFMDGIDGIAGAEAVTAALALGVLLAAAGQSGLAFVAGLIVVASLGFTVWNWPPAKIFMGDVGSGLLGFLFGGLAVAAANAGAVSPLVVVLLLGVFVFDSTATLIRRFWRRERWYAAHRSHAYQRLTQAGWSHRRVTLGVVAVNVGLAVLAFAAWSEPRLALILFAAGMLCLAVLYWWVERRAPMLGPTATPAKVAGE